GAVILPLLAAGLASPACRMRSFMSATGLIYLAMIAIFPGQLVGQLLLFVAAACTAAAEAAAREASRAGWTVPPGIFGVHTGLYRDRHQTREQNEQDGTR